MPSPRRAPWRGMRTGQGGFSGFPRGRLHSLQGPLSLVSGTYIHPLTSYLGTSSRQSGPPVLVSWRSLLWAVSAAPALMGLQCFHPSKVHSAASALRGCKRHPQGTVQSTRTRYIFRYSVVRMTHTNITRSRAQCRKQRRLGSWYSYIFRLLPVSTSSYMSLV